MAAKGRGLGKGLDSLIPVSIGEDKIIKDIIKKEGGSETIVDINKVTPNHDQPRKNFDKELLERLADSIKMYGIVEPILVQDKKDHFEIIAGERRWRAAKIAGLKEVPVLIRDYDEQTKAEIALLENLHREDLNAIEEAMGYQSLMTRYSLTQEEVARRMSKDRTTITNSLRLLKLGKAVQKMVINKELSGGHARALIAVTDEKKQLALAERVVKEKLSVRDIEKLVKEGEKPAKPEKKLSNEMEIFYKDIAEKMKRKLGTKVTVKGQEDGTGKIEIEFYSNDDLDRIKAILSK